MGNRRRQGTMTPWKVNKHTIEDLVDSEGDETSASQIKRMIFRMLKELKEDIKKTNSMNPKRTQVKKKLRRHRRN
jgi:hypothetical protein